MIPAFQFAPEPFGKCMCGQGGGVPAVVSFAQKLTREMEQWILTIEVPDTFPETWTPLFTNSRIMGFSLFEDLTVLARCFYFSWGHTDGSNLPNS